jgi:hypothetical protein
MHLLLGWASPFLAESNLDLKGRVQAGHEQLVFITGKDFGYDPQKWHEYLAKNNAAYRWSNLHLGMPKRIAKALNNQEWQQVVQEM